MQYGVFLKSASGWKCLFNSNSLARSLRSANHYAELGKGDVVIIDRFDGRKIINRFNKAVGFKLVSWCNGINVYCLRDSDYNVLMETWHRDFPDVLNLEIEFYRDFSDRIHLSKKLQFVTQVFKDGKMIEKIVSTVVIQEEAPMDWNRFGF